MPPNQQAISDFIQQTKEVDVQMRELAIKMNLLRQNNTSMIRRMSEQLAALANLIATAKILAQYLQDNFKKEQASPPMLAALQKKIEHLEMQATRLQNISLRMMNYIKVNQLDPEYAMLLSAPKPPAIDPTDAMLASAPRAPTTNPRLGQLVKETLDKLQEKAVAAGGKLSPHDRKEVMREAMSKLPDVNDKLEFSKIMREEIKRRNLETLSQIHAPTHEPAILPTPPRGESPQQQVHQTKQSELPLSPFEEKVKRIAQLPTFDEVKKEIYKDTTLTSGQRWELIVAVREEIENNKLKAAFPDVPRADVGIKK